MSLSVGDLNVDTVDLSKPFLYHQPTLSFVFSGPLSTKRLPTQLVFPNGRVAIGQIPVGISESQEEPEGEDDEARITRLRQDIVVAYADLPETQMFDAPLKCLSLFLLLCIAFQTTWIGVILSGGQLYPFGRFPPEASPLSSEFLSGSPLQRAIYTNILVLHLLSIIGILYRLPAALSIYNVMQFVNFTLTFTCCLYSVLDIFVLGAIIPIRLVAGNIEGFLRRSIHLLIQRSLVHPKSKDWTL